eukprot:scaffold31275_cov120-Isochrysis_galbana.AAC.1
MICSAAIAGHTQSTRLHTGRPQRAPATPTSVSACLADASAESAMAAPSAVLRASEKLGARSTGGVSDPQTALEAQPGRPTARPASR